MEPMYTEKDTQRRYIKERVSVFVIRTRNKVSEILSCRDHIPKRGTCDARVASETAVGVFEAILWERIPLVVPTGLSASLD